MRLDLVIPAHNEEARIGRMLHAYRARCSDPEINFLVAIDGSDDETSAVVQGHARIDPRVHAFEYPKLGKGGVVMETFRRCEGDLVGFVDADGATPPAEFLRLVDAAENAGGAIASRRHPSSVLPAGRTMSRRVTSVCFYQGVRTLFGLRHSDTQCGAKVLRREVAEACLPFLSSRDFLFDVDLLFVARRLGFDIVEVPTIWIEREGSRVRPVGDARRMAASAMRLWLHHKVLPIEGPGADAGARDQQARPCRTVRPGRRREAEPDVALVGPYPSPGVRHSGSSGVASYTSNLAHALSSEGARVAVVAPDDPSALGSEWDGDIRVHRAFPPGVSALPRAADAALSTGAPVVHLQHELFLYGGAGSVPGLAPSLLRLRKERALVVTMHQVVDPGDVDESFSRLHGLSLPGSLARAGLSGVRRTVSQLSSAVIVHEEQFASVVPQAIVVPHGVESVSRPSRRQARAALGIDDERFVALCFGFLAPYKGLEIALRAAELSGADVDVVVAGGDHPRHSEPGGFADCLRVRWGHVADFTGHVPERDIPRWFAASDVGLFLYPHPHASSGGVALATAYGTPLLTSPALARCLGAPTEVAVDLDPETVARRLRGLVDRSGEMDRLAQASRALGTERSWRFVARRHIEIYEEVSDADGAHRGRVRAA